MREIKFRAWLTLSDYDDDGNDKDYTAMIKNISVSSGGYIGFSSDEGKSVFGSETFERAIENGNAYEYDEWCGWEGQFELMQYTGLKDKNGVEIYEGDIIRSEYDFDTWDNGEVAYKSGQYLIKDSHLSLAGHLSNYPGEVIGNIYENPELIK